MATNHTEHYNLSQWVKTDPVLMSDFNEDNKKIDAAIAARGNCRIAAGTYVGDGSGTNTLDFADTLGHAPKLLFVKDTEGGMYWLIIIHGEDNFPSAFGMTSNGGVDVTWTETGLKWRCNQGSDKQYNTPGKTYTYVAFG